MERARSGGFEIGRNSLRDGKGVKGRRKRDHNKTSSTKKKDKEAQSCGEATFG